MKKTTLILLLVYGSILAQQNDVSFLLMGGNASDNDAIGNFGGGGASYQYWESGLLLTMGVEANLNTTFSFQGILSYSRYPYKGRSQIIENTNNAANQFIDVFGRIKWNIGIFYIFGGMGFSFQHGDAIIDLQTSEYYYAGERVKEKMSSVFAGTFGFGFDIYIYKDFSLLIEGDLYFREYLGSAWQIGAKYTL